MDIITKLFLSLLVYGYSANGPDQSVNQSKQTTETCAETQSENVIKYIVCYDKNIDFEKLALMPLMAPAITASKTFMQVGTDTGPTGPSPGDVLEYTVIINNASGGMDATGTKFDDTIDPNTTLVAGSLKTSVVAINDAYSTVGNISIVVPAASGLIVNDVNLDGDVLAVTAVNTAGTQGNVTFAANGSFTFNPSPGFEGSTTFTYTVNDGTFNSTGTVTVTVTGMIWFINAAAAGGGDGRLSTPFNSMNSFNSSSLDGTGDNIFVYEGTYTNTLATTLLSQQKIIGQGAVGASLAALAGVTFSVYPPISPSTIPGVNGTRPTINQGANNFNMQSQNQVRGVNINNTGGTSILGSNFTSALIREVSITNTGGVGVNFMNGALDMIIQSVSVSNSNTGIFLSQTTGSFQITGTGTTDGSGGTFTNISGRGIELRNTTNITLRNMSLPSANSMSDGGFDTLCDEDDVAACYAAIYMNIVNTVALHNIDIGGTEEHGIMGLSVSDFTMDNCTAINNGNLNEENALKFRNLSGTCSITNSSFQNSAFRICHIINITGNLNLTVNNCTFNNSAASPVGQDCFEMRTQGSATATVALTNSLFQRARSKGIQVFAEGNSSINLNITGCSVQRFGGLMAGIEVGSNGAGAVMNYNINNNSVIESSGEVAVLASTFITSDINGRVNNNASITNNNTSASIFSTIRVLHENNGQAILEVKNNPDVTSSNIDIPVDLVVVNGNSAASSIDVTMDNNNITNSTTTVAGIEGIVLRAGDTPGGTDVNTFCGHILNNDLTLPAGYARAFRVRHLDAAIMNLQGSGPDISTTWINKGNTTTNGAINAYGPNMGITFSGFCAVPSHAFAAPEPLAEKGTIERAVDDVSHEEVQEAPAVSNETTVDAPVAMAMMSGETVSVGGGPGFPLPAGQTMTVVFRVTIDNPFPLGDCAVSNQGTVSGSNFASVLTDDPGVSGAANPTVTNLNIAPTITVCQGNITTGTDPNLCTASESFSVSVEGCSTPMVTYKIGATTITSPYIFPIGITTVDVTVSNGISPDANCSFTVTVTDTQAPDITCLLGNQMRGTNLGNCSYTVQGAEFNPTVNENCPGFTLTNDFNNTNTLAGAVLPIGTTSVVWTITDGASLTDMCTVTIVVADDDAPTITCPGPTSTPCNIADLPPYANLTAFTSAGGSVSDNCGVNSGSFTLLSQTGGPIYTRTYQITDINGFTNTCTQTVTVNPTPDAMANPTSQTICSGEMITTIVLSGNVGGTVFNWVRDNTIDVTGIAANGAGNISGTLNNNTNAPVTVTFTITPTANGCFGAPITATVLVNPVNTIALSSAPNTNMQTAVLNNPIQNITYNTTGATGATFSGLPPGVMGSWSGDVVTISGSPNTTAMSPYNYTVTLTGGCGTVTAMGTITVIVGVAQIMGGSGYSTLQDAIDDAVDGNTILLLQNITESNLMVSNSVLIDAGSFTLTASNLTIPAGEYLRWLTNTLTIPTGSSLSNLGTLWNNGTIIHVDPYINAGTYKGTGTFNGNFTNNGSMQPGN